MKGTYAQRLRVLMSGILLTLLFGFLGSITGGSLWLSVAGMAAVAFLSGLFKNLGDRGSGLSLCVYVMFLIANAHPVSGQHLQDRLVWILIGGFWNAALGLLTILFLPVQQPYRRNIAIIWRANAALIQTIAQGWNGKSPRSSPREIYLNEKGIREAIDKSFQFHEAAAHQVNHKENADEFQLAQLRKAAALIAAHAIAINEELEGQRFQHIELNLRLKVYDLLKALQYCAERMAIYILTRRNEERLLLQSRITMLKSQVALLLEDHGVTDAEINLARIAQLSERAIKLIERSVQRLEEVGETHIFRSYSLIKTIWVLHPKHLWRNIRLLFYFNTHTAKYVVRTALASALAMSIYKFYGINHGYWLPFTVIIVLQPYFGATFRKALDRTVGTVLGGLAGGLLLRLPAGLHLKEIMLFTSAVAMVYFFRLRYTVSSFFITLNLVLLFSVYQDLDNSIILIRLASTIAGAVIAVSAGFILLPTWDRNWLPRLLVQSLHSNYEYFVRTAYDSDSSNAPWTRFKRQAEISNSNAFDSFNRFMSEPTSSKKAYALYYSIITHNVRITRELTNIQLEEESKDVPESTDPPTTETLKLTEECETLFLKAIQLSAELFPLTKQLSLNRHADTPLFMNTQQLHYMHKMKGELIALITGLKTLTGVPQEQIV
jgi:uncharacterized membrane protein YccC